MSLMKIIAVAALAAATAACTHATERQPAMAQIEGDTHVVVRAEAGHVWWAHNTQSEPHELWSLPARGEVENLAVAREADAFVVTFEQGGTRWQGRFGSHAEQGRELARRDR